MTYLSLLQKPGPPLPASYLSLLQRPPPAPLPEGALAGTTAFALAYNALLTHRRRLTAMPQSRRPLLDGRPLSKTLLVELLHAIMPAWPDDAEPPSIDTIQRAATAHAFATPAADPYESALRGWLAHEIVSSVWLRQTNPAGYDEGVIAHLSFAAHDRLPGKDNERVPYWFVSTRAIKAELNAFGPEAMRRIRATMKTLGWRERKCWAWGGRQWGFIRPAL
jgi:hypothetical protein